MAAAGGQQSQQHIRHVGMYRQGEFIQRVCCILCSPTVQEWPLVGGHADDAGG